MMEITLLCNAGLALREKGHTLLVDAPNGHIPPFSVIGEDLWHKILSRMPPFENICGLVFTHTHADHCDLERIREYAEKYPDVPVFMPAEKSSGGNMKMGPFSIAYGRIDHAPMNPSPPPHSVLLIDAGQRSVYLSGDAEVEPEAHRDFLQGRKADAAFWTSMYLSRPQSRQLLLEAARKNYIYHMPEEPDGFGLWRKCRLNFQRYGDELKNVTVLSGCPTNIEV